MVRRLIILPLLIFAAITMFSLPASAARNTCSVHMPSCGNHYGRDKPKGGGSPGPIAGVGLPFLIGGVVVYRRRRKSQNNPK